MNQANRPGSHTIQPTAIDSPVVVIVGPTAIGKTSLSLFLASHFPCEIVGADSMQVYRHMDIGTAKPSQEEMAQVPHHLIDVVDPDEDYQAASYGLEAFEAVKNTAAANKIPLVVGGTGLYVRALIQGMFDLPPIAAEIRARLKERMAEEGREVLYEKLQKVDSTSAGRIHPNDTQRLLRALEIYTATGIPWSTHLEAHEKQPRLSKVLKICLTCDREALYDRINQRVKMMMEAGLEKEVRGLLDMGYDGQLKSMQSLGYRHMQNLIKGEWERDQTIALLSQDTRRFAKRQLTWFGQDPDTRWFTLEQKEEILGLMNEFVK